MALYKIIIITYNDRLINLLILSFKPKSSLLHNSTVFTKY